MLVRDFVEVPMPALNVVRNQPEGTTAAKAPKSCRGRRVPLPDALVPALRRFGEGKSPDDLLMTRPGGGQLHRSMSSGRPAGARSAAVELHDLRHTAACEWILRGVPLTTVQAWRGHGSIEVTARYLHHLGDSADRSAMQLLNDTAARALGERA
jgi:integrase